MKRLYFLILIIFISILCIAEIPKTPGNAIFEWNCDGCNANIWDMIYPVVSAINENQINSDFILPSNVDMPLSVNQYNDYVNAQSDTLFLFVCSEYMHNNRFRTFGWTASGDTLTLGNPSFLGGDWQRYPIMKYVAEWDTDTISKYYSSKGIAASTTWTVPRGWASQVFRLIFSNEKVNIQGCAIIGWASVEATPQDIEATYIY